jgi:hypothetical protein
VSVQTGLQRVLTGVVLPKPADRVSSATPTAPAPKVQADKPKTAGSSRAGRFLHGCGIARAELRAWWNAADYDIQIAALHLAGDHKAVAVLKDKAETLKTKRRTFATALAWNVAAVAWPVLTGGWVWATVAAGCWLIFALFFQQAKAMHGGVVMRAVFAFAVAMALQLLLALPFGVHPNPFRGWGWAPAYLLPPLIAPLPAVAWLLHWMWEATKDDGSIADNLPGAVMAPEKVEHDNTPQVVKAIKAAGGTALKDITPALVQPGVTFPRPGVVWTASADLGGSDGVGGPSAEPLVKGKTRAELAAQLGLSRETMLATVDRKRGSRLHMVGIVGDCWSGQPAHPFLSLDRVDTWRPFPIGVDYLGRQVTYTIPGTHTLAGGETGSGKSVFLADVWTAFALSPPSLIHVIDGGEVNTKILEKTGLATAWTTDRNEGIKILAEVLAEVDRRQTLLAQADDDDGDDKATPQWMDEHGLGHNLLLIDELPTYTQDGSKDAKTFADLLRELLQRARKTGIHLVLSAQSPSVDVIDSDSRSIIAVRWAGRARDVELAAKILGSGTIGRGVDPRDIDREVEGLGWYSDLTGDVLMRPYHLTRRERKTICERGVELRRGATVATAADEDRILADRVAALIRSEGFTVPQGRVMPARDVATRLSVDQMQLREALGRIGTWPTKVSRPDDGEAHARMHYVLSDLPVSRAI